MHACTNCKSDNLVRIDMTLGGEPVGFTHCRRCEHRWWSDTDEGAHLSLAAVLEKAAA